MDADAPARVAVITGAGQGLGRAYVKALAADGWSTAVVDIDLERAGSVAGEIAEAGGTARAFAADVGDQESLDGLAAAVAESLGTPVALINNAAIFSTLAMGPFEDIDEATWERVIRVNLTGVFFACKAFVPAMRAAGYGKIVNIASGTVLVGRPGYLHYVASKAGVVGLTRALASEVGPAGIRVNVLSPGATRTEVPRSTVSDGLWERLAQQAALRRSQTPDDLIGAMRFLCSPDSDFMTGQLLNVDGGVAFH